MNNSENILQKLADDFIQRIDKNLLIIRDFKNNEEDVIAELEDSESKLHYVKHS